MSLDQNSQTQTRVKTQIELSKTLDKYIRNDKKEAKARKTATYYKNKLQIVTDLWENFKVNNEFISLNPSAKPSAEEIEYVENDYYLEFAEKYLEFASLLEDMYTSLTSERSLKTSVPTNSTITNNSGHSDNMVKLPRITLPTFSGDYTSWTLFKDLFVSLINSKRSLANSQKLHYLKASLTGEAESLVKGFAITDANYSVVWELLQKRYENLPALVNSQFDKLFQQTSASETSDSIKALLDSTVEAVQALENLKIPDLWKAVIVYMTVQRFPSNTRQIWEQQNSDNTSLPTYDMLKAFLESRFRVLDAIGVKSKLSKSSSPYVSKQQSFLIEHKASCPVCSENHNIRKCPSFHKMSFSSKQEIIKRKGLCLNCLNSGHIVSQCPSKISCYKCRKRHHTLLHINGNTDKAISNNFPNTHAQAFHPSINRSENTNSVSSPAEQTLPTLSSMHVHTHKEVLLSTALITIESPRGDQHVVRALLDQGSQATFITEHLAQMMQLPRTSVHASISAVGKSGTTISQSKVNFKLITAQSDILPIEAFVLRTIANLLPSKPVTINWNYLTGLKLADPFFNTPGRIDVLLGADIYPSLIREGLIKGSTGQPVAQNTVLGWILSGEATEHGKEVSSVKTFITVVREDDKILSRLLQQFWEIEEAPQMRTLTQDEEICEQSYIKTHRRLDDGRYVVRLPFLSETHRESLGQSKAAAFSSLLSLEKKLLQNTNLKREYQQCINDYLRLGHMYPAKDSEINNRQEKDGRTYYSSYYLPHHAVVKESTTTKVRVVFDASRKSTSGLSLNNILSTGPSIQNEMIGVLLRWRSFKYAYIADIEKMYRQIKVHEADTTFQRILWRNTTLEPVKEYCLNTVTFGVTCAPYLAIRTLNQLAHDESKKYPIASHSILNDFYVDDLLSGADELEEAILKQKQTRQLLSDGGFRLRKWVANDNKILQDIPSEDIEILNSVDINPDNMVKSLGLVWHPHKDNFGYRIKLSEVTTTKTKRELLSEIAKLFDPLGWISPFVIRAKIMMQSLWLTGLDWDQPVPENIELQWISFKSEIPILQELRIPRWIGVHRGVKQYQLHCFSDASQRAYAAVAYLRIVYENNQMKTYLLMSKTKVAPLRPVSIPNDVNPPLSPHFGGLWEAGVKSTKYHLRRILGNTTLTFEELSTVVTQVESCLNSRPLCPLTADPADLNALTPGHFLIGDALLAPPQMELLNINQNRLDRWQLCQQLVQQLETMDNRISISSSTTAKVDASDS